MGAILVLGSSQLNAQIRVLGPDSGYIFTFVSPGEDYRVKINGELQEEGNKFAVKRGKYTVSVWAPHYEQWDTTFTLDSKRVRLVKALTPKPELITYEDNMDIRSRYKQRMVISGTTALIFSTIAIFNYQRIGDLNLDQIEAENGVDFGIEGYNQRTLDEADKQLKNARTLQYVVYGGMALTAGYSIYNYIKMKQFGMPKLSKDDKFVVDGIGVGLNQSNNPQFFARIRF